MRADGELHAVDRETGKTTVTPTKQCAHCGRHWIFVPGSGRRRGWCTRCNGITCGNHDCHECVHWRQKIENAETGRPLDNRPLILSVGRSGDLSTR